MIHRLNAGINELMKCGAPNHAYLKTGVLKGVLQ
jgi:hypothetical protein